MQCSKPASVARTTESVVGVLSLPHTAITFIRLDTWPSVRKSRRPQPRRSALHAAPLIGIREHEQVQTGEEEQDEREKREEANPGGVVFQCNGDEVDDNAHRKGNRHPAMGLPNPFAPVHWGLPF